MDTILNMNWIAQSIIGIIVVLFLATLIYSGVIRSTYKNLIKDINDKENRKNKLFKYKMHNDIVDDFNGALTQNVDEINTISIIEKNISRHMSGIHLGERFVKKSVSLMIILGLLGTFYGLILSIEELVTMLGDSEQISGVESITSGLISSITGMSVAFVTSMFGIGASILTNILTIIFGLSDAKESLIIHIEEYLDNHLMISKNGLGPVDEDGNTALSLSFDRFNDTLTSSLKRVADDMSNKMNEATGDLVLTAESVKSSVVKFDHALNMFSDNIRDFTEFNHHLRANIQRLNVGLDNFNDQIEEKTKIQSENTLKIDQLNQTLSNINKEDR
jgi:hypothetical protein